MNTKSAYLESLANLGLADRQRRKFLQDGFASMLALSAGPMLSACGGNSSSSSSSNNPVSNIANIGNLQELPDASGLRLPPGFSSRVVGRTDEMPTGDSPYIWHDLPDGGATFPTPEGGWIYVSNSEANNGLGGVGAIEFDADANLVDAYSLLQGTTKNCAGGPSPWNTWLSCEEYTGGMVWECFPLKRGNRPAIRRDALGVFQHEAAAVDPETNIVYLTEDQLDGCLYRFIPDNAGDLSSGRLQAAVVDNVDAQQNALEGRVSWVNVPDPSAATETTRVQAQQQGAAKFIRGEGAWFHAGVLYISTTVNAGDRGLIWAYESDPGGDTGVLTQIYNRTELFPDDTSLNGVDNITVTAGGDVVIAEDSDDMQMHALTPDGLLVPLLQVIGHTISGFPGEITGPAFDPSGTRLYFSSQRGTEEDLTQAGKLIGITYEVTGPFVVG